MHSKIFQITRERVNADEFITTEEFSTEDYSWFADWIQDVDDDSYEDLYESIEHLLDGVFTRNGDELTYVGAEKFCENWMNHIKALVEPLTVESVKEFMPLWLVKSAINNTHLRTETKIYFDGVMENFGDFIRTVFASLKTGDKLYLGGVVDFHW